MADHLILSLQAPPFLIFPSSLYHRWGWSRRFSGGIRFSVPEFRLSSQLKLANSTSPSQSSSPFPPQNSAPAKFDLVSSTQLKDGSYVFRFGDASEIEKYLEAEEKARCVEVEKQNAKIAEEASEVSRKQGVKDLDRVSNIETSSENEETAAPSNLSNVIKIKDRKRVRSPTKKKKETVNVSRSEDKVDAKIASVSNLSSIVSVAEAIPTSSTEGEEEVVVSDKSEPINEKEITAKSYNVEPLSSEVMEKVSVNKIGDRETNGYQGITENPMEVQARPSLSTAQQEVAPVSTIEIDDNLDVREKPIEAEENLVAEPTATAAVSPDELVSTSEATHRSVDEIALKPVIDTSEENLMKTFEAEENLVVEPTATAAVSSDELISTPEATHHSVDEIAQKPVIDTSEETPMKTFVEPEATHRSIDEITEKPVVDTSEVVNDGENVASTIEDEITVRDTITDNGSISKTVDDTKGEDLPFPAPETVSPEPIEVASGREELVSKALYLDSGFASLQTPFKALAGREDAYFISHRNWIGIADGVSQWSFEGLNKGVYAYELMSNCEKIISDETAKISDPVQVLHRSVSETKSSGSSTALIAHLDNNELHIANIGDSGFMVIREGTVLQNSSPMFHHFCFPLHITQGCDVLKLAEVYHVNLEEGDVVIAATDGLFDNLYEKEIVSIVCRSLEQSLEPQKIAELVAAKAQEVGQSETERTPFADAAKEEGYDGHKGGKLDAVTVIVSLVKVVST
ncbi:PPM-type phosphatase domain [Arabidopsis suecica]|uniref:Protein phosphatase n=1 Tax=Arabidopsis suecica TaxID=45249 RepID=A0A8T1YGB2_ARASU|nr:PPM-type phosphatase domain [Arabidopsis suecica]